VSRDFAGGKNHFSHGRNGFTHGGNDVSSVPVTFSHSETAGAGGFTGKR